MSNTSWIDRKEYPFESRYFAVPAGRLHYVDEGDGSPIVMVHGNPTWSFLYRDLIKRLKPTYRCIVLDHIGFGLSDKPATAWLEQMWGRMSALNGKPKLFVWGMKDIAFRDKELKRWEQTFPEARSIRLDSVGHYVPEEAPNELAEAVIPFLAETEPAKQQLTHEDPFASLRDGIAGKACR